MKDSAQQGGAGCLGPANGPGGRGASGFLSFVSLTVVAQPAVRHLEKEDPRPADLLYFVG